MKFLLFRNYGLIIVAIAHPRGGMTKPRVAFKSASFTLLQPDSRKPLGAVPVSSLLRSIAAHRHAAPTPRVPPGVIGKQQCADWPLTRFHIREIFFADQLCENISDRQEQ